jgi:YesN/AraC family two-component response regulator
MEELTLLFVDDEPMVLKALERMFRRSRYRFFLAESAERALKIMEQTDVNLLITDHRMPGLSGVELCRIVAARHPGTMRFILSAYTELEEILTALKKGEVQRLLSKPLDMHRLLQVVDRAVEQTQVIRSVGRLVKDLNQEAETYGYEIDFTHGTIKVSIKADSSQVYQERAACLLRCLFEQGEQRPELELISSVLSRHNGSILLSAEFGVGLRLTVSLPVEEKPSAKQS